MGVITTGKKNSSNVPSWEPDDFSGPSTLKAAAVVPTCWPICFMLILGKWVVTHFLWSWCFRWARRCCSLPSDRVCIRDGCSCLSQRSFLPWHPMTMLENNMYFRATVLRHRFHALVLKQRLIKPPYLTEKFSIFPLIWLCISGETLETTSRGFIISFPKQNQAANDSEVLKRSTVVQCSFFFFCLAMLNSVRSQFYGNSNHFKFKHEHQISVQPILLENARLTEIIF